MPASRSGEGSSRRSNAPVPVELTKELMRHSFALLDNEIGKSDLLMSVAPLRCITVGGSLAVMLCGNRASTQDVDIILDPNVRQAEDYWDEFKAAIAQTAKLADTDRQWMNEEMKLFVARDKRQDLFLRSVQANIKIFAGLNLEIYAGDLYWALERKLRRVSHAPTRRTSGKAVDLSDAAALIHTIRGGAVAPLNMQEVREYNLNTFELAPSLQSLQTVARFYFETYGDDGLAEYAWDENAQAWKWQGQDKDWRWV